MVKKILSLLIFSATIFVISGCGLTEEEVIENINDTMQIAFNRQAPEANMEFDGFDIFLPERFTVLEESISNIIFNDQEQTYILFYNRLEPATSDAFYLSEKEKDYDMFLRSYEDDDQFSYVKIVEIDDHYELQVGTGGVRITTYAPLNQIEENFEELVQILNSMEFHNFDR